MKILTAMRVKLTEGEEAASYEKYFRGKREQGLDCYLKVMEGQSYLHWVLLRTISKLG